MSTDRNLRKTARRQQRDEQRERARLTRLGFDPMTPLPIPTTNAPSPQVPPPGPLRVEIVDRRTALAHLLREGGARAEYPISRIVIAGLTYYTIDPGQWKDMCDEIDGLRGRVANYEEWAASMAASIAELGEAIGGLT